MREECAKIKNRTTETHEIKNKPLTNRYHGENPSKRKISQSKAHSNVLFNN